MSQEKIIVNWKSLWLKDCDCDTRIKKKTNKWVKERWCFVLKEQFHAGEDYY